MTRRIPAAAALADARRATHPSGAVATEAVAHASRHTRATVPQKWEVRDALSRKRGPHATVYFVNGDRYRGEWLDNQKHGSGTYYYSATGAVYQGDGPTTNETDTERSPSLAVD
ncbi:hypothetical protein HK405_000833 [Cladochytrium tenue]|nr:hypothetical protein HK405_000833 [Cladochytrium tenue]